MNVQYTYTIDSVDNETNTMMVSYRSEGLPDAMVSTRLPFDGETVEEVVKSCAPFSFWEMSNLTYTSVEVGVSGNIDTSSDFIEEEASKDIDTLKKEAIDRITEWRNGKLSNGARYGEELIGGDHKTLNTLRSIKQNISDGIYASVDFKLKNGAFTVIDGSNVDEAISIVATYMQSIFTEEKAKVEYVNALTDIDAVVDYNPELIPSSVL